MRELGEGQFGKVILMKAKVRGYHLVAGSDDSIWSLSCVGPWNQVSPRTHLRLTLTLCSTDITLVRRYMHSSGKHCTNLSQKIISHQSVFMYFALSDCMCDCAVLVCSVGHCWI